MSFSQYLFLEKFGGTEGLLRKLRVPLKESSLLKPAFTGLDPNDPLKSVREDKYGINERPSDAQ